MRGTPYEFSTKFPIMDTIIHTENMTFLKETKEESLKNAQKEECFCWKWNNVCFLKNTNTSSFFPIIRVSRALLLGI